MKEVPSLYFNHIPKFLKNDLIKRLEINTHHPSDGALISKLSAVRSSYGGAKRDRTVDLLRARQALSQLSYGPITKLVGLGRFEPQKPDLTTLYLGGGVRSIQQLTSKLVGLGRFELPTSPLSGVRSNQLSYRPESGLQSKNCFYRLLQ